MTGLLCLLWTACAADLRAFSWSPVPETCEHITPFVWFREGDSPTEIAKESLRRPAGRRVLFCWDLERGILSDPEDRCRTAAGELTDFQGVWPEHGVAAVKRKMEAFFGAFRLAGGQADWLILDFEGGYSNWHLGGPDKLAAWQAIAADPRFPALAERLGFTDLASVADWRSGRHYLKWNAVTAGLVDAALNEAVFDVAREHFPDVQASNYGSVVMTEENAVPDLNGHWQWREGLPFGTHQAPSFYTTIGQLAARPLDGEKPFGNSPFAGLLLTMNELRAIRRSSAVPVTPWVAWARYTGDGPGRPIATVGGTPYYRELIYHLALHDIDTYLFWNPHPWRADQRPEDLSMPADEELLDRLLAELGERLGDGQRGALTLEPIPWGAQVLVSGMKIGERCLWRVTLPDGTASVEVALGGQMVTVEPPAGEVGAWVETPAP